MLYLKHMCTDHSCIENSDIENKHLIFENRFLTKINTTGNHIFHHTHSQHTEVLWLTWSLDIYIYTEHSIALVVNHGYQMTMLVL